MTSGWSPKWVVVYAILLLGMGIQSFTIMALTGRLRSQRGLIEEQKMITNQIVALHRRSDQIACEARVRFSREVGRAERKK